MFHKLSSNIWMGLELAHDTAKTPAQFVGVNPALVVPLMKATSYLNLLLKRIQGATREVSVGQAASQSVL